MENQNNTSILVISNDYSSHVIHVNKNTNIGEFYQKIISVFPQVNNIKLFYYEGYSYNKLYVSNEQEYVTANKKCIEYFYLCNDNSDEGNDKIDYLKYHSVIVFSPIKKLNREENNEKRKEMQLKIEAPLRHSNTIQGNINSNMNLMTNNMMNNNMMNQNMMNNNMMCNNMMNNNMMNTNMMNNNMMNYNLNNMINNFNMMNVNNCNYPNNMNNMRYNGMNNMMMNNNMMFQNNPMMNNMNNMMMNYNNGNFNMNNINNQMIFLNNINNLMYSNPMMFYNAMRQINPFVLQNLVNNMMANPNINNCPQINQMNLRSFNSSDNIQTPSQIIIPDYETIDTESNPMNKYIENAINFSYSIKQEIIKEKQSHPNRFIDIENTLSSPGLLSSNNPTSSDYKYLLCLIGKILSNKKIEVGIYKDKQDKDRIDLTSIQFIFSGLINKKKFTITFSNAINEDIYISLIHDLSQRKKFIEEWKTKISNKININKNLIILTNPRERNSLFIMDLAFNPSAGAIDENKLKIDLNNIGIVGVNCRPLLEGCRLSPIIISPKYNKYYSQTLPNLKRGGEDYIQPLNWTVYGINVSGKYDFGNNRWLGNKNQPGEFAVAYYGINNLVNKNMNLMGSLMSLMGNLETGNTFINVKNSRKPGQNCKSGAYFYKNPNYAENSSEITKIGGFEYKIMFMCRVKPSKIMQPENFKDCWILSPSPDEVRPYKILIKKIPKSPLAIQSQQVIQLCLDPSPPPLYFQILQEKDESFYQKKMVNYPNLSDYDYVLKLYSQASSINSFLRNPAGYNSPDNKSNVWCLHKAITKNVNNVKNGITVYRGVCFKLPNNIGVGTKFYFPEFLSTSTDIKIAQDIAMNGTLMYINIQNNGVNGKKVYCRNIEYISDYPFQKEILFTSYCQFKVTQIKKTPNLDLLYLTCEGHNF